MTIGENIKKYRKAANLTQRELAEKCESAPGTIQQYELGKRQPRIEQLKKIASVLMVQVPDLIGGHTGEPVGVSPEHPVAFPGLEEKLLEIGYRIGYKCDYVEYDDYAECNDSDIWIDCPDKKRIPISLEELETLNSETDIYLKFRIDNLKAQN